MGRTVEAIGEAFRPAPPVRKAFAGVHLAGKSAGVQSGYVDPKTKQLLPTFDAIVDGLDTTSEDAEPAHAVSMGTVHVRGIDAGTPDHKRAIKYITKYVTKDLVVDQTIVKGDAQRAHLDRLHEELSVLPCSERCANWLLYGVQPKNAKPGLTAGRCKGKVHQRATLGYTGRRCLVSRNWSNKTLTDHRHDGREWFRAITAGLLDEAGCSGNDDGRRYYYQLAGREDQDVPPLQVRIFRSIAARNRALQQIQAARDPGSVPATTESPSTPDDGALW